MAKAPELKPTGRPRADDEKGEQCTPLQKGNHKDRLAARLKRDHPAIAARVAIGVAIEAELKATERRGRPKADNGQAGLLEQENVQNFAQLDGQKSRQIAAEKAARVEVLTVVLTPGAKPTRQARSLLTLLGRQ